MNRKMQVAALLGATMLSTSVWAQETDEIIVLSSPFNKAATDVISTTEIISAEDIVGQISKPIGDVLSGLPGVDSAGYGPAVGQPVIRGLGVYRVDVMQNGMSIGDISSTSGDHANTLSLFDVDRVEVLKGPAALRYGAYAATGVVNSFNRHLNADTEEGTDVLFGFGDNADETITSFFTRQGQFSLSAFSQDADNITIPTHAKTVAEAGEHADDLKDEEQEAKNTESESNGFTAAGHFGDGQTNLALMLSSQETDYLVPHEHDDDQVGGGAAADDHGEEEAGAAISLEQQTVHLRLTHNGAIGPFSGFRADLTSTSFEQTESVEEEENNQPVMVNTNFDQDSLHLRTEFTGSYADWQTLVGLEFREAELTAIVAHAEGDDDDDDDDDDAGGGHDDHGFYLPNTERSQYGLFAFAERERNDWLTELAVRFDSIEQDSFHEDAAENASVSHDLTNISAGLARKLDGDLLVGGSVSSTERAPSQVELFAEGKHHAVGRTEMGDPTLDKETSLSTELYIRKAWEGSQLRVAVFNNDYSDFIYLDERANADHTFDYKQQDAELSGYEFEYKTMLALVGRMWDASLSYSSVTGELNNGDNLPLMPADKLGFGIGTSINALNLQLDVEQVSDQTDLGEDERKTDGHTKVDVSASYQPPQYEGLTLSASVRNLTDEEIRHHTSPLKEKLPEAGQDIRLTARYKF
ncbi:MAG: TonB-dependent receptor [Alphaproteobacteria bacterium]|nr:TonB-dependent receptor [Alphaproteobacteria bacterium]